MGFGTIIRLFGAPANLDGVLDGETYRKVAGVDANGQISQASIGPGVSFSASLGDGSVQSNHIASGAVMGYHIADGQVQGNHVGGAAISSGHIADGAIQANHIASGAIQGGHIPDATIMANHIASNQIDSEKTMGWSGSFYADGVTFNVVNGLIIGPSGA